MRKSARIDSRAPPARRYWRWATPARYSADLGRSRNRSPNALENSGAAPFKYNQYGYSFGGPVPGNVFKDRLFFFGAQEWVNYRAVLTNTATVPSLAMRRGDFSELLNPNNAFFSGARVITDPLTGQPFAGNVIPTNRLSPNGMAFLNTFPVPTPGFRPR